MASIPSNSETEFQQHHGADYIELPLVSSKDLNYVDQWVNNLTVDGEVARGARLRDELKRRNPKVQKKYDVVIVNVNSKKAPGWESDKSSRQRKRTKQIMKLPKNSRSPCRSCSPSSKCPPSPTRTCKQRAQNFSCSTPNSSRSRSKARNCPLRIAELAVPSKRYCIETWRNKAETLPVYMVQRLKKHVMDESPVVHVSDAITCFQQKLKHSRSCKNKKVPSDKTKFSFSAWKNAQDMLENRNLCAVFGHKLAKKMIMPMNITLTSDWQKLSDVINGEIANLLKGKTRLCGENCLNKAIHEEISNKEGQKSKPPGFFANECIIVLRQLYFASSYRKQIFFSYSWQKLSDVINGEIANLLKGKTRLCGENCLNKAIHEEISNKITVWIATVLEDSSYKLLEEDLRAKKNKERRLGKEEKLVTLIENHVIRYHRGASELEEEEGPALEFIDNLVNNVMKVCKLTSDTESYESGSSDSIERSSHSYENGGSEKNTDENETSASGAHSSTENSIINMSNVELEHLSDHSNEFKDQVTQEIKSDIFKDADAPDRTDEKHDESSGHVNTMKSIFDLERDPDVTGEDLEDVDTNERNEMDTDESNPVQNTSVEGTQVTTDLLNTVLNDQDTNERNEMDSDESSPVQNTSFEGTQVTAELLNTVLNDQDTNERNEMDTDESNSDKNTSVEGTQVTTDLLNTVLNDQDTNERNEMDSDESSPVQNITVEGTHVTTDILNTVLNNQDDIKVSEVVVVSSEEPHDDKNKKVTFSDLKLGDYGELIEHFNKHSIGDNTKNYLIPNLSWTMSFQNKPDITIAAPNDYLLSDADESWPKDFITPMLRVTESVSKSITPLGRIAESEEKVSTSQDEESIKLHAQAIGLLEQSVNIIEPDHSKDAAANRLMPVENGTGVENFGNIFFNNAGSITLDVGDVVLDKARGMTVDNAKRITVDKAGGITVGNVGKITVDDGESSDDSSEPPIVIQVEIHKIKPNLDSEITSTNALNENKNVDMQYVIKEKCEETKPDTAIAQSKLISGALLKDVGRGDHNNDVVSVNNLMLEAVQKIINLPYVQTKFDYRVDPSTAPAWAICSHPREDLLLDFSKMQTMHKLKESEVRKWCKDLEQSFINLEQWNNWVDNTCKQVMFYKQRGELNKVFAPNDRKNEGRHWVKLKKTVDRDAVLWTKLSQRTRGILQKYRCSHKSAMRINEEVNKILLNRQHSSEAFVLKALDEIDRHCLWMHRLIVSTEYCVKCKCKNYARNSIKQEKF